MQTAIWLASSGSASASAMARSKRAKLVSVKLDVSTAFACALSLIHILERKTNSSQFAFVGNAVGAKDAVRPP